MSDCPNCAHPMAGHVPTGTPGFDLECAECGCLKMRPDNPEVALGQVWES